MIASRDMKNCQSMKGENVIKSVFFLDCQKCLNCMIYQQIMKEKHQQQLIDR